jgi:hypothetical protein
MISRIRRKTGAELESDLVGIQNETDKLSSIAPS